MKKTLYNRKTFIVIVSILMSVSNGIGAIFLPYFSKFKFLISSGELGFLAFLSSVAYVITALTVARIQKRFKLKNSLLIFLLLQLLGFVSVLFIDRKFLLVAPFLLIGVAQGGWWPLIEGAMCEGQNAIQKKRAVAFFNYSWLSGMIIGPPIAGLLYESNTLWPLWGGVYTVLVMIGLVLMPRSLLIAPWKAIKDKTIELPRSLKHFIKLGIILNFLSYLFISSFRALLVEFTDPLGISSVNYGIIQASFNFGILCFMYILMRYDFWQFSLKLIIAGICTYMLLLFAFANATEFTPFLAISFLLGAPCALFYFSSLYYGMLGEKSGADHGGHHEAMIGTGQSMGPLISGLLISLTADPRAMFYWLILTLLVGMIVILVNRKKLTI